VLELLKTYDSNNTGEVHFEDFCRMQALFFFFVGLFLLFEDFCRMQALFVRGFLFRISPSPPRFPPVPPLSCAQTWKNHEVFAL